MVDVKLNDLESLCSGDLRALYIKLFNVEPPVKSRKDFLLGNISWAIQAKEQGQNFRLLRGKIISRVSKKTISSKTKYLVGTRIVREWKGVTYEVIVEEHGFRWQKHSYKSLSHIARKITGARWSGPRFFGLTNSKEVDGE